MFPLTSFKFAFASLLLCSYKHRKLQLLCELCGSRFCFTWMLHSSKKAGRTVELSKEAYVFEAAHRQFKRKCTCVCFLSIFLWALLFRIHYNNKFVHFSAKFYLLFQKNNATLILRNRFCVIYFDSFVFTIKWKGEFSCHFIFPFLRVFRERTHHPVSQRDRWLAASSAGRELGVLGILQSDKSLEFIPCELSQN